MKTVSLHISMALLAAVAMLCTVGCDPNYITPIRANQQNLTPEQRDYQRVWDATCKVLNSYYFKLDRQDHREGVITTFALCGKQWFEFWRKDSANKDELLENSMHTIYRVVKVSIVRDKNQDGKYTPQVEVLAFRSNRQTDDVDVSFTEAERYLLTGTYDETRASTPKGYSTDEYGHPSIEKQYLASLGRDKPMEQKLTTEIKVEMAQTR